MCVSVCECVCMFLTVYSACVCVCLCVWECVCLCGCVCACFWLSTLSTVQNSHRAAIVAALCYQLCVAFVLFHPILPISLCYRLCIAFVLFHPILPLSLCYQFCVTFCLVSSYSATFTYFACAPGQGSGWLAWKRTPTPTPTPTRKNELRLWTSLPQADSHQLQRA